MPEINSLGQTDFSEGRYLQTYSQNTGKDIDTEGILRGFDGITKTLEDKKAFETLKSSPFYVRKTE